MPTTVKYSEEEEDDGLDFDVDWFEPRPEDPLLYSTWTSLFELVLSHMPALLRRRHRHYPNYQALGTDMGKDSPLAAASEAERNRRLEVEIGPGLALLSRSTREKLAFSLGVVSLYSCGFLMGWRPQWIPHWYASHAIVLITLRWFSYRSSGWHYFLADLCYYTNALTLIWCFWMPISPALYMGVFCLVHGPVSWAILAWRNSLVFHSLDKVTSLFIHIGPPITLYSLRWLCVDPPSTARYQPQEWLDIRHGSHPLNGQSHMPFFESLIYGLLLYMFWQLLYYIGIIWYKGPKIHARTRITSYTWLLDPDKNDKKQPNLMYRLCTIPGWGRGTYQIYFFIVWQFLYALLTILPAVLFYNFFELHTAFLLILFMVSAWNGARQAQ